MKKILKHLFYKKCYSANWTPPIKKTSLEYQGSYHSIIVEFFAFSEHFVLKLRYTHWYCMLLPLLLPLPSFFLPLNWMKGSAQGTRLKKLNRVHQIPVRQYILTQNQSFGSRSISTGSGSNSQEESNLGPKENWNWVQKKTGFGSKRKSDLGSKENRIWVQKNIGFGSKRKSDLG